MNKVCRAVQQMKLGMDKDEYEDPVSPERGGSPPREDPEIQVFFTSSGETNRGLKWTNDGVSLSCIPNTDNPFDFFFRPAENGP